MIQNPYDVSVNTATILNEAILFRFQLPQNCEGGWVI